MIQVYTGDGKGKTTSALGLALRAAGAGFHIYIAQFAKAKYCSELKSLKKFKNIKVEQFGACRFIRTVTAEDKERAMKGLLAVKKAILQGKFNMVILDEINVVLSLGILDVGDVLKLLKAAPKQEEIVLTGRCASPEIVEIADLVSEIKQIKHYYSKGIKSRKGIEW